MSRTWSWGRNARLLRIESYLLIATSTHVSYVFLVYSTLIVFVPFKFLLSLVVLMVQSGVVLIVLFFIPMSLIRAR